MKLSEIAGNFPLIGQDLRLGLSIDLMLRLLLVQTTKTIAREVKT